MLNQSSTLYFQVPYAHVGEIIRLSGKRLRLQSDFVRFGLPQIEMIRPHASLYSRYVTIKNATEPEQILGKIEEQLHLLGVTSKLHTVVGRRRIIRIHGNTVRK